MEEDTTHDGMLWYPSRDKPEKIKVELYDSRAADDLVIWYDFDRDGYVIERGEEPDVEVAFIPAWSGDEYKKIQSRSALKLDPPVHDYIPDNTAVKAALGDFATLLAILACVAVLVYLW